MQNLLGAFDMKWAIWFGIGIRLSGIAAEAKRDREREGGGE